MTAFVESLHEVFERFGRIQTRRMFGGHGIYHEQRMIGLVIGSTLYLKADAESVAHFERLQLPAFTYTRDGKAMQMSYRQAPAELFEDREEAALWGQRAYEAALRSGQPPKARKTPAAKTRKATPKTAKTANSPKKAPR
ncbi:MAG: TfoX family protein [Variovorax sp.]|nr:MAG: TfoX family protein [Variovorax sp.]